MVEIREETSDSEQQQQPQPNQQSTGNAQSTGAPRNTTLLVWKTINNGSNTSQKINC
jgi:hypothetical protein